MIPLIILLIIIIMHIIGILWFCPLWESYDSAYCSAVWWWFSYDFLYVLHFLMIVCIFCIVLLCLWQESYDCANYSAGYSSYHRNPIILHIILRFILPIIGILLFCLLWESYYSATYSAWCRWFSYDFLNFLHVLRFSACSYDFLHFLHFLHCLMIWLCLVLCIWLCLL